MSGSHSGASPRAVNVSPRTVLIYVCVVVCPPRAAVSHSAASCPQAAFGEYEYAAQM